MTSDPTNRAGGELAALLPDSPDAYPQNVDLVTGRVLVVRLDERSYRAASFLDDRILTPATQGAWFRGSDVGEAAKRVTRLQPLHFIFHTGHVGSTLVSRMLDETGVVLPLREPLPLRVLADANEVLARPESLLSGREFEGLLETMLRLWSRGYERTRAVVVKATSSAGGIAPRILAARPQARAVYLNLRAEPYLATLLGGVNSPVDLRGHAPGRMRRLTARLRSGLSPLHAMTLGELAALGWLSETLSLEEAVKAHPERVLALDFDAFVTDVQGGIARVLAHFGLPHEPDTVARLAKSPVLHRYSKAPELPFPPGERDGRLAESRRLNRGEIARGLAWLERTARADDGAAAAVSAGGS